MWEYAEAARLLTLRSVGCKECIYCQTPMWQIPAEQFEVETRRLFVQVAMCVTCGWWHVYRVHQGHYPPTPTIEAYSGLIGCLKELDLEDITVPMKELRSYLMAKREQVHRVHPRIFEEVVCSIFSDCGWQARVTSYSGDDGIDVILDGENGKTVGVQVKRNSETNRIEAEQIRSLAGALMLNGHTKGVFVTTSNFRRGAKQTAEKFGAIGIPIELIDAQRFFDALGIAQRKGFYYDQEKIASYIVKQGVHLGAGLVKEFEPGEDLTLRPVLAQAMLGQEFIDLYCSEEGRQ